MPRGPGTGRPGARPSARGRPNDICAAPTDIFPLRGLFVAVTRTADRREEEEERRGEREGREGREGDF